MANSETRREQLLAAEAALVDALGEMEHSRRGNREPMSEIADACAVVQRWRMELEAGRWPVRSIDSRLTHRVDSDSEDTQ